MEKKYYNYKINWERFSLAIMLAYTAVFALIGFICYLIAGEFPMAICTALMWTWMGMNVLLFAFTLIYTYDKVDQE